MPIHHVPPSFRRRLAPPSRVLAVGILSLALATGGGTAVTAAVHDSGLTSAPAPAGHYIVTMRDQPAATYDGTLHGLARTKVDPGARLDAQSDSVQRYSSHLREQHHKVAASVGVEPASEYSVVFNGFAANLTSQQVKDLAHNPDVLSVDPDAMLRLTSTPDSRYLGLEGEHGLWAAVGGADGAGTGTVIADLDTGIAPDNPSFAGAPLGTTPGDAPYLEGTSIVFHKADGGIFHGTCQAGEGFATTDCSTKIINARSFLSDRDSVGPALHPQETRSPRDTVGHGSHTASTAAGNAGVPASVNGRVLDTISGMAPAAKIAAYKVCFAPKDETSPPCDTVDILSALDQATIDGVDVINLSLETGNNPAMIRALYGAASAGIFVAASAGNSGPDASTVRNTEPWVTTVGASSVPNNYGATATLGDGRKFAGASLTVTSPLSAPLILGSAGGAAGARNPLLCGDKTLDPAKVGGRIVVCERGESDRVTKSAEVKRAGGVGMLLINPTSDSQDFDPHSVPTVHFDFDYRQAIEAYAATAGATATLTPGDTMTSVPRITGWSSRGPQTVGDVIKPDISAPGESILAAMADEDGKPGFGFDSGTSMSSPHIAGLALVYLGRHPQASPAEIKSAMMTTATDTVDAAGKPVSDPFTQGAGEVAPRRYLDPGLLYLSGPHEWAGYAAATGVDLPNPVDPVPPSQLNLPSIAVSRLVGTASVTRTVTSQGPGTWKASVTGVAGMDVKVVPSSIAFTGPGQTRSFEVRLTTKPGAHTGEWTTGSLTWTGESPAQSVRSPIAVKPLSVDPPEAVEGSGVSGSADITVTSGVSGRLPLTAWGAVRGHLLRDTTNPDPSTSGSLQQGYSASTRITVPEETKAVVLDVNAQDGESDMDLTLERVAADGTRTPVDTQSSPSSSERITLVDPTAGTYLVTVTANTVAGSQQEAVYDLVDYEFTKDKHDAAFRVDPASLQVSLGEKSTYRASWSELKPGAPYVGMVTYDGSEDVTLVHVTTPNAPAVPVMSAPPVISGTPDVGQTLTATTGTWSPDGVKLATQWLSNGAPIPGETDTSFRVTPGVVGTALSVRVTATAPGGATADATSAVVTARYPAKVSALPLQLPLSPKGTVRVFVFVSSDAPAFATGKVTLTVGRRSHDVVLGAGGVGFIRIDRLAPGRYPVRASYSGDAVVGAGASREQVITVGR